MADAGPTVMAPPLVHRRRPAMATWFEIWLAGDDEEHLTAVAEAALDEVERVERLLSRFDPTSEVARLNRDAAARPLRVDPELFAILQHCQHAWEQTDGAFDPLAPAAHQHAAPELTFGRIVQLDADRRTVQFNDQRAWLDFGGYGKGYALDQAAELLARFGVETALLHGGTSSVRAIGAPPWRVALRDPFVPAEEARELAVVELTEAGLSSSAVRHAAGAPCDVVDPTSARPLETQAACTVVAPTAAEAEVLSTSLLTMGKRRAAAWLQTHAAQREDLHVAWIEPGVVDWVAMGATAGLPSSVELCATAGLPSSAERVGFTAGQASSGAQLNTGQASRGTQDSAQEPPHAA